MERERPLLPHPRLLVEAVAHDYSVAEIQVSFPEQWQWVATLNAGSTPLYLAGLPPSQEALRGHHFYGLPAAINRSLTHYRLYKLFDPWPSQQFQIVWHEDASEGRLVGAGQPRLQLRPRGQAQVWTGDSYGVLWEAYLYGAEPQAGEWEIWRQLWQAVGQQMGVQTIFTGTYEPAFPGEYPRFLRELGYEPDLRYPRWWRKQVSASLLHKRG